MEPFFLEPHLLSKLFGRNELLMSIQLFICSRLFMRQKKQALNTKVHGVVVGSFEAASKHVNQADFDYEKVKQKESDYADIVHASETIVDWDMKDAFQRLDPVVQSALKQVQQAAHQFLYGDVVFIGKVRSTTLGQDAYIRYRFEDSKVVV